MKKLLIIADKSCSKQTFVSRANNALVEAGFDYRMMLTRGECGDVEIDRPVSAQSSYNIKPKKTDLLHFPQVVQCAVACIETCRLLILAVKNFKGPRFGI